MATKKTKRSQVLLPTAREQALWRIGYRILQATSPENSQWGLCFTLQVITDIYGSQQHARMRRQLETWAPDTWPRDPYWWPFDANGKIARLGVLSALGKGYLGPSYDNSVNG